MLNQVEYFVACPRNESLDSSSAGQQSDYKQRDEDEEQYLGDSGCGNRDSTKPENRSDNR